MSAELHRRHLKRDKVAAGRIVLLTGAAGAIGTATAVLLSKAGYRLGLLDRDAESVERAAEQCAGATVVPLVCDLAKPSDCERAVLDVSRLLGPPDILINNAAIYPIGPWEEVSLDEWNHVLAVNLTSAFLLAQLTAGSMKSHAWGRIVNIASVTFHVGLPDRPHYVASKGGLIGLTRTLARELGASGITVNSVSPGAIQTPMEPVVLGSQDKVAKWDAWVYDRQCLRRRGLPEDIAAAIAFLISDAASFITAQDLLVDGGWAPK